MAVNCNTWCISALCKDRKKCACQCDAWFAGTNPVLIESCQGACYNNPNIRNGTAEDFMCSVLDPQEVFNRHGYICPDFNPLTDSAQGQAYAEQQKTIDEQSASSQQTIIFAFAFMLVLLLIYLYVK
jgi:hypothetical protein